MANGWCSEEYSEFHLPTLSSSFSPVEQEDPRRSLVKLKIKMFKIDNKELLQLALLIY